MEIKARDNVILAMQHTVPYWIPNSVTDCDIVLQSAVMERYEGRDSGFDEFGVEYIYNEEAKGPIMRPGTQRLKEIEDWHDLPFPDLEHRDWEAAAKRDTSGWDRENRFSIVQLFNGMFERAHMMMGFEDVLCALLADPEEMQGWFEKFTDYRIELIRHIAKYYKPDAIMIFDDYGAKESMMFGPDVFRELIKPQLKRMIDTAHECGLYYILHGCGYYKPIFADIVALGADAVHPVQVMNDPEELKAKYGDKITFLGGFDNVRILDREGCSEEETRAEVRRVLTELAPGGSFVAWRSFFCVHPEVYMDEYWNIVAPEREKALRGTN
ncbi:MAG: uroporphyrinogen decarboxylase family protein [Lachnospiraceae bacterium]